MIDSGIQPGMNEGFEWEWYRGSTGRITYKSERPGLLMDVRGENIWAVYGDPTWKATVYSGGEIVFSETGILSDGRALSAAERFVMKFEGEKSYDDDRRS